jgi:hypothetical protein
MTEFSRITLLETSFNMAPDFVDEGGGKKFLYLTGPFLESEKQNRNGRIYPRMEIDRVVREMAARIQQGGPIAGELDHPEGLNLNFDRVSHAITEIHMDQNLGVGKIKVADNQLGHQIRSVVELGVRVGVSSRGSGSVDDRGVVSDYNMVTIDAVLQPSANAYPTPVIEAFQQDKHGREAARLAGFIREDKTAQLYMRREVERFLVAACDKFKWGK